MSIFSGEDIGTLAKTVLASMKRRIDAIPYRRLKDLRPEEIEDIISDFSLHKVEIDFQHPSLKDFKDGKGPVWCHDIHSPANQFREVMADGRRFIFECPIISGYEYVLYSPYGGAEAMFFETLSDHNFKDMDMVEDEKEEPFVRFSVFVSEDELSRLSNEDIPQKLEELQKQYLLGATQRLQTLNSRIDSINQTIDQKAKSMIAARIKHDSLTEKIASAVGLEIVPKNEVARSGKKIEIVPKRKIGADVSADVYEGYLDSNSFNAIVSIIREHLLSTENHPEAIRCLRKEELIRDTILWALESSFYISTGESFRQKGKTDICIPFKNKSAFIAECKIWDGKAIVNKCIDQLLNYTTWRDSKMCVLLFNLETLDFGKICRETLEEAKKHRLYKKTISQKGKNEFALSFNDPSDENSTIEVTFLLANYVARNK